MYLYLSRLNRLILLLLGLSLAAQRFSVKRKIKRDRLNRWTAKPAPLDTVGHGPKETARLAATSAGRRTLGGYRNGQPVWVYRGAGWSRGTVESVWERNGTTKVVVKLADERGGHPYTVCHDSRNICRRNDDERQIHAGRPARDPGGP